MERKVKIYRILTIIFLVGFIVFGSLTIRDYVIRRRAEKQLEELAEMNRLPSPAPTSVVKEPEPQVDLVEIIDPEPEVDQPQEEPLDIYKELGIELVDKDIDWDILHEINEDIYAWIYVPGTVIDYPIVQKADELDYYLEHNLDGSVGRPGGIYTQYLNSKDFTDKNTIIYGHNLKNGTMFSNLHYFEDSAFFEDHPYFYIYTPEQTLVYQIYATVAFNNKHILKAYNFNSYFGYAKFIKTLDNAKSMRNNRREMQITTDNRLVTLSTCIQGEPDKRYIAVGVLIDEAMGLKMLEEAEAKAALDAANATADSADTSTDAAEEAPAQAD